MNHAHKHDSRNCRYLLDSLSEYIDGTLNDELCAELEHHLSDCDNCQVVVDSLRKTIYLYHETAEPPAVPEDVRRRLFLKLDLDEFLDRPQDRRSNL